MQRGSRLIRLASSVHGRALARAPALLAYTAELQALACGPTAPARRSQVALWMSNVHMAIEELIKKHAIRKIETRGDCYIVISGCNSVEGDISGLAAPALSSCSSTGL